MRSLGPVAFRPMVFKSWTLVTKEYPRREKACFRYDIAFCRRGKTPNRAANADLGVVVPRRGVRSRAQPHPLPDRDPAGQLRDPGNGRAAQARLDARSGALR